MIKPTLVAFGVLCSSSYAFQVSSPSLFRSATIAAPSTTSRSRVLIPQPQIMMPRSNSMIALSATNDEDANNDDIAEPTTLEVEAEIMVDSNTANTHNHHANNNNNALVKFANKLKQALASYTNNKQPAAFFLSCAIFLLPFFLLSAFPESAWAVQSGGRMGGSFGGSSSRQSSSRSYRAPSSSSGSYSRGYSRGYSSGYYSSRPNVIVTPGISPFYSPFYSPFSPFYARPSGVVVSTGPSFLSLFFFAGFFIFAASVLSGIGSSASDTFSNTIGSNQSVLGPGVSVAEISVALEVPNRDSPNSILSALDRLSRTARTDSRVGLQNLTSQVAMELLRRKLSIVAASTRAYHYRDENKAQREYNNISIQERGKFQRETVSKYGGVDYSDARMDSNIPKDVSGKATIAVVTIVMMIDGDNTSKKLSSRINSIRDVEDALSCIAADSKADDCLRGAEILWTPEERDETLTMREVFADYSSLRSV